MHEISMNNIWYVFCLMPLLCSLLKISALTYSITTSQSLNDGETIASEGGSFELGFFSPGSSSNRYLGIWYKNIPIRTVVWVANRQNPLKDLSGTLMINSTSSLVLSDRNNSVVWSTKPSNGGQDLILQLLDSGNLVLRDNRDGNTDVYLWQSFDYPSDTLLPGMKLGWDLRTGLSKGLSSWKNFDDPSPGTLSNGIELGDYPQVVMWKGSRKFFRGGPWNGLRFSGAPELRINPVFGFEFVSNQEEVYYMYQLKNKSVITRLLLNETTSSRQRYVWLEAEQSWKLYASVPRDYCDNYALCGANGICSISDSPVCKCLEGFKPKSAQSWNAIDWSQGCIRNEPLDCQRKHGFIKFSGLKLPDTTHSWINKSMNLKECRETCLKNCSCNAYTNSDISGRGSGCALWFGDLVDIRTFSDGGQDLYIRMPASNKDRPPARVVVIIVAAIAAICVVLLVSYCVCRRKTKLEGEIGDSITECPKEDMDLPIFNLATISHATDNFSVKKKLGEGGFGPVYKGTLEDGQNIAVKKLSKSSGQGINEFKNEVKLIEKLQHRNLVKLLGCCIEGEEKILIYEYLLNGSLDSFVFDRTRGKLLDWPKRFNIICGVARGLLYLHQDSRLRIIHRDLKASNVLLDKELNPKISDFGMARTFGGDESGETTKRVVGTYGYMAPEYAFYGLFSVKSDVFSFGILLLEILSGKKNRGFDHPLSQNLIGYGWRLWTEGRPLELIDSLLEDTAIQPEMLRCIHIALLCVQQSPEDRPTMSSVVLMLNGESTLPQPKHPGFLIDLIPGETGPSSSKDPCSANYFSITSLEAR
ncbi:G-type lectin S-receptor-like serine/threonine-protein kinase At4g27290 isoform X1 [Olea europaea var. sylvestris]|uniref:Receptor-like serine/threonine-protein kinase n=3 Tax=Olea europaea subsp. europaea TaxID=158383 RepID=A0A8S0TXX8_OLEEU|nr:G-type lectin S-receptor-like serine/threonine-protein kinase At4g27290 isoform X1 [Olea europaea var. sylvestris]CAA3009733.1 G-type lectin S-receptor-like serine threonine-kinase At4g27290 isoform X1 [Olea europaea subsp. europaea]